MSGSFRKRKGVRDSGACTAGWSQVGAAGTVTRQPAFCLLSFSLLLLGASGDGPFQSLLCGDNAKRQAACLSGSPNPVRRMNRAGLSLSHSVQMEGDKVKRFMEYIPHSHQEGKSCCLLPKSQSRRHC